MSTPAPVRTSSALGWDDVTIGDHLIIRREFSPVHPTTGDHVAEWRGRLIENSRWGFSLSGEDGRRHGFFAWKDGPGYRQIVTRRPGPASSAPPG
ncbi:hypothetical protein ACFFMN_12110 [Planobispora siamensis]|uniref:Uncharacterized protein n=1 Tax=Planobispora siamensis TaxID=936338 RepID=A0A8J3SDK1_9ACTN|nr:hypothetical protein [Planobispora siamensis]GIH89904.1 hypothetical protein Psi01_05340 [Planobispora siamensis]